MQIFYDPSILFSDVIECLAFDFRGSRNILHTRNGNFFPVRPGQRCLERLTVCTDQIQVACPIGCKRYRKALNGGPGLNRDFARFIFQVPVNGVMCPVCARRTRTKPNSTASGEESGEMACGKWTNLGRIFMACHYHFRYCSSVTCSIQSTTFPWSFSWIAIWVRAVVGVAPCQCFSPDANQTTSPGRTSSMGPSSR